MRNFIKLLTLSLFILIDCPITYSQVASGESLGHRIDSLVNGYYQSQKFSGSVLVSDQGKVLVNKEYGYMKLGEQTNIHQASVFEIASISKQFTAMLIMMLQEEKKLDFDDKISNWFPKLPYPEISIRHLLTHTSGFSEKAFFVWAGRNMDPKKIYTNKIVLRYLHEEKPSLAFEPGEKWEYSNLGYFLLALIIEQTSEKTYISFLTDH